MKVTVKHQPSYALAHVELAAGESIKAEAGAMATIKGDLSVETKSGGVMKGLKRAVLGGESFFQNTFTAGASGGTIALAPSLPGDIYHARLEGHVMIVQDGSYLASHPSVDVDTKWAGAKGFFSGEGFVMLRVSGHGDLLLSSYGAIEQHDLAPGERLTVDTGHIVAFLDGMPQELKRLGSLKSSLFGGEGIVSEFTGPGAVWTQSRSSQSFLDWLAAKLPGGGGGGGGRGGVLGGLLGD